MSYGLNVEMHKQVRDLIMKGAFFYKWLDTMPRVGWGC